MARVNYGETIEVNTLVTDRDTGLLADAGDLTFQYMYGDNGTKTTVTPTRNSIGDYSVSITTTATGRFHGRWDTAGAYDVADEITFFIRRSPFEESNLSDYN